MEKFPVQWALLTFGSNMQLVDEEDDMTYMYTMAVYIEDVEWQWVLL